MAAAGDAGSVLTCGTRSEPDPDRPLDGGAASPQQDDHSPGGCSATGRSGTPRERHGASPGRRYGSAKSRCILTTRRQQDDNSTAVVAAGRIISPACHFRRTATAIDDDVTSQGSFSSSAEVNPEGDGIELVCCRPAVGFIVLRNFSWHDGF